MRTALGLGKRDKISYTIGSGGQVILSNASQPEEDPVLEPFLNFLALDIKDNPRRLQAITTDMVSRARSLTDVVEIDLNAQLSDEDE